MGESNQKPTLFTIGHSNHTLEHFLALLAQHGVEVVVDVRSQPCAQYAVHFNGHPLAAALRAKGFKYLFLGKELGGRPEDAQFYDEQGFVRYDRLAQSPAFQGGIERLLKGSGRMRVALLCGEEDPRECHRRLLIGRVLAQRGVTVLHIRGDGRVQTEAELAAEEEQANPERGQLFLFETSEEKTWRSIRSVSPREAPPTSSAR